MSRTVPVTARQGAALFVPLTLDENRILCTHLESGWYKQAAVWAPAVRGPLWQETDGLLRDLHVAFMASPELAVQVPRRRAGDAAAAAILAVLAAAGLAVRLRMTARRSR